MLRKTMSSTIAFAALVAGGLAGGSATAVDTAKGYEFVAEIGIDQPTHLEFMTRVVRDVPRTFALVGSRSAKLKDPTKPANAQTLIDATPGGGLNIIDITDPENATFVLNVNCQNSGGAADIAVVNNASHNIGGIVYDQFIAIGYNDKSACPLATGPFEKGGVVVVGLQAVPSGDDVLTAAFFNSPFKNVVDGKQFAAWKDPAAHTVVPHPTKPIVYAGNQVLGDRNPSVEILDFSKWPPEARSFLLTKTGVGPHDITFRPDGNRAYASSINLSFVWDTSGDKALAPELVGPIESPNLKIHHEAVLHPNGRHLLVVDEFIATSTEGTPTCPGGGVHIFDLGPRQPDGSNLFERAPVVVGQFYADDMTHTPAIRRGEGPTDVETRLEIACTAHEFNIAADGTWMPLAWMGHGVRELDLSPLMDPALLASPAPTPVLIREAGFYLPDLTDTWAAKQHVNLPGYVFSTDTEGFFRILRRVPAA